MDGLDSTRAVQSCPAWSPAVLGPPRFLGPTLKPRQPDWQGIHWGPPNPAPLQGIEPQAPARRLSIKSLDVGWQHYAGHILTALPPTTFQALHGEPPGSGLPTGDRARTFWSCPCRQSSAVPTVSWPSPFSTSTTKPGCAPERPVRDASRPAATEPHPCRDGHVGPP